MLYNQNKDEEIDQTADERAQLRACKIKRRRADDFHLQSDKIKTFPTPNK